MKLRELIDKYSDAEIVDKTIELYPDEKKNRPGYEHALEELHNKKELKSDITIRVETVPADGKWVEEPYIDVDGYTTTEDNLGLDFMPWGKWLNSEIDSKAFKSFSELEIVSHIIWELTWHGFEEVETRKKYKDILKRVKEVKEDIKNEV